VPPLYLSDRSVEECKRWLKISGTTTLVSHTIRHG
jgi:hypothetical protein